MRKIYCLMSILLTSCATTGTQIQSECESRYSGFVEIFNCTRSRILAESPGRLNTPQARLYMLQGEQLAAAVEAGSLTSLDAKVEWAKARMEMQRAYDEQNARRSSAAAAALATMPAAAVSTQPTYQIVKPSPAATTSCTTQSLFGTMQTSCTTR